MRPKWFTADEICDFLDIPRAHFDKHVAHRIPDTNVDRSSRKHYYYGRMAVETWLRYVGRPVGDDMMGNDTTVDPELQRFRAARADIAEMDRDQRSGQLVRVEEMEEILIPLAATLRGAADSLRKHFGEEAWKILDDALVSFEEQIDQYTVVESFHGSDNKNRSNPNLPETVRPDEQVGGET